MTVGDSGGLHGTCKQRGSRRLAAAIRLVVSIVPAGLRLPREDAAGCGVLSSSARGNGADSSLGVSDT